MNLSCCHFPSLCHMFYICNLCTVIIKRSTCICMNCLSKFEKYSFWILMFHRKYWLRFSKNLCWCLSVHRHWKVFLFIILSHLYNICYLPKISFSVSFSWFSWFYLWNKVNGDNSRWKIAFFYETLFKNQNIKIKLYKCHLKKILSGGSSFCKYFMNYKEYIFYKVW